MSITEDIEWSLLQAKLEQLCSLSALHTDQFSFDDIVKLLDNHPSSSGSSIPPPVLTAAPHLTTLAEHVLNDSHLQSMWKLCQAYALEKAVNPLINLMQLQPLVNPIPCTIWCSIIQDQYVNFETSSPWGEVLVLGMWKMVERRPFRSISIRTSKGLTCALGSKALRLGTMNSPRQAVA